MSELDARAAATNDTAMISERAQPLGPLAGPRVANMRVLREEDDGGSS
jgi:hypothetical protein